MPDFGGIGGSGGPGEDWLREWLTQDAQDELLGPELPQAESAAYALNDIEAGRERAFLNEQGPFQAGPSEWMASESGSGLYDSLLSGSEYQAGGSGGHNLSPEEQAQVNSELTRFRNAGLAPEAQAIAPSIANKTDAGADKADAGVRISADRVQTFLEEQERIFLVGVSQHGAAAALVPQASPEGTDDGEESEGRTQYGPREPALAGTRMSLDAKHSRLLPSGEKKGFDRPLTTGKNAFDRLKPESRDGMQRLLADLNKNKVPLGEASRALTQGERVRFLSQLKSSHPQLGEGLEPWERGLGALPEGKRREAGQKGKATLRAQGRLSEIGQKAKKTLRAQGRLSDNARKGRATLRAQGRLSEIAQKGRATKEKNKVQRAAETAPAPPPDLLSQG